jgi:hypothetical protein
MYLDKRKPEKKEIGKVDIKAAMYGVNTTNGK